MSGTCYGFAVRSDLPLAYLRGGAGDPLEIRAPAPEGEAPDDVLLIEWQAGPERPLEAKLWSDGRRFRLWIGDGGWFAVDPAEPRIDVPADGGIRREERLWGIPALLCFLARGDLPLHAAACEVDGGAVVLAAPRTYGKTTMAASFHRAGHRVLSEDTACVRLGPDAAVMPGARLVGEDSDRVHYVLESPGDCEPVPLRAIVFLDEGDSAALEPVEPPEALRDLWALSFRLPTEEDVGRSFAAVADLTAAVPVLRLRRPLALDALADHVALVVAGV
jgi:hypothetical protein